MNSEKVNFREEDGKIVPYANRSRYRLETIYTDKKEVHFMPSTPHSDPEVVVPLEDIPIEYLQQRKDFHKKRWLKTNEERVKQKANELKRLIREKEKTE